MRGTFVSVCLIFANVRCVFTFPPVITQRLHPLYWTSLVTITVVLPG